MLDSALHIAGSAQVYKRALARFVPLFYLLACTATSLPANSQSDGLSRLGDEALLTPIRLAARGGDFDLANKRLARLKKPHLVAMGTAALAAEHERAGSNDEAKRLYEEALELTENGKIQARPQVSTYLYIAKLMNDDEDYAVKAEELLAKATSLVGSMAGFDLDMSLVELAQVGLAINRDEQQAKDILMLVQDQRLRDKLLDAYGFVEKNEEN